MEYTHVGRSGLRVSRIALGCMSFGDVRKGFNEWALDDDAAAPIFRTAVELGINFWDTANVYGRGTSEEVVGRAVRRYAGRRDNIVLATKLFFPMHDGPGGSGLSRKAILEQVHASLRRLGTDYIDLYQVHRFDPSTPIEETMSALSDLVTAGKVRYLGACSMWPWQLATMQHAATRAGGHGFVSMQHQYSLLRRRDEDELFDLLEHEGMASLPWSPLARGWLARPWDTRTTRALTDTTAIAAFGVEHRPVVDALQHVAQARGVPMPRVALAWVLRNPRVTAPIVGATAPAHLKEAVEAIDFQLTAEEVAALVSGYPFRVPMSF